MLVLGIESSCDETAAAVVAHGREIRSSVVASQVGEHAAFGWVFPEVAARRHLESIASVVERALQDAMVGIEAIEGVAVTRGPGLAGSLLVGFSYAKALALGRGLPWVGVNHIEGHIAAIALEGREVTYPAIAMVVSGGHTAMYLQREADAYRLLGRTRDDAVGEAYDKVARLLGLGYPGGPVLDRLAREQGEVELRFPASRMRDGGLDFSFSGLKSAVSRYIREHGIAPLGPGDSPGPAIRTIASAFQRTAVTMLCANLRRAIEDWRPASLLLAGGVACNSALRSAVQSLEEELGVRVHLASPALATDNAAMIAARGYLALRRGQCDDLDLDIDPDARPGDSS